MCQELHRHVRQGLVLPIDQENLQKYVIVVYFDGGLSIDGIGVAGQLIYFCIDLLPDLSEEIFPDAAGGFPGYFLCDIEVVGGRAALQLAEDDYFIGLGDQQGAVLPFLTTLL